MVDLHRSPHLPESRIAEKMRSYSDPRMFQTLCCRRTLLGIKLQQTRHEILRSRGDVCPIRIFKQQTLLAEANSWGTTVRIVTTESTARGDTHRLQSECHDSHAKNICLVVVPLMAIHLGRCVVIRAHHREGARTTVAQRRVIIADEFTEAEIAQFDVCVLHSRPSFLHTFPAIGSRMFSGFISRWIYLWQDREKVRSASSADKQLLPAPA